MKTGLTMLTKTKAIILHHIKYGETSLLVTSYTEYFGRLSFMVKGARSSRSKFPMICFQPLNLLELNIYYKPGREVQILKEISFADHYMNIPFEMTRSCIAIFLADVLYRTLREEESNTELFNFLWQSFILLDHAEQGVNNFHLAFLLHFSKYLGIFPAGLEESMQGVVHEPDLQSFYDLPEEAFRLVIRLLSKPLSETGTVKMNGKVRSMILEKIIRYFNIHLEDTLRIKSHLILKEVFNNCHKSPGENSLDQLYL